TAANIVLNTSATTDKFSGFDIFENDLLNYLVGGDLAEFDDPDAMLTFEDLPGSPPTITLTGGTTTFISAGFEEGQTIKIIGSNFNDGDDYTIASLTSSVI